MFSVSKLGQGDQDHHPQNFESPSDADTGSISVQPGDVVILASDGLFDNVAMEEIVRIVEKWEEGPIEEHIGRPWKEGGQAAAQELAERLVLSARELSLDKHRVRKRDPHLLPHTRTAPHIPWDGELVYGLSNLTNSQSHHHHHHHLHHHLRHP